MLLLAAPEPAVPPAPTFKLRQVWLNGILATFANSVLVSAEDCPDCPWVYLNNSDDQIPA